MYMFATLNYKIDFSLLNKISSCVSLSFGWFITSTFSYFSTIDQSHSLIMDFISIGSVRWIMGSLLLFFMLATWTAAGEEPYVVVDDSSDTYLSFHYCGPDEPCKSPYDQAFNCKCLDQYVCATRSPYREAHCTISLGLGYIYSQPSFAEGHFVLDPTPSEEKRPT